MIQPLIEQHQKTGAWWADGTTPLARPIYRRNDSATDKLVHAHSTPDPDLPPPPHPNPDDVPPPDQAPIQEPTRPAPPIKA